MSFFQKVFSGTARNVPLLCAVSFLQGMVFYGPIATLYRQAAGVSVFEITLIESLSLAVCILCELPWGMLAERIGYKNTLVLCNGLYFVSKLIFWRAEGFGGFLAERLLLGVVLAGVSGCDVSMLYLSCPEGKSQRVFGIYDSLGTAGLLAASLVYARWIGQNYRLAGLLTAVSYGLAALLSLGLAEVRPPKTEKPRLAAELGGLLRGLAGNRQLAALVLGAALLAESHQTITVFLNQLQYRRAGLSDAAIGYLYVLVTLAGLLGALSDRFARWLGRRRAAQALCLAAAAACLALAFCPRPVASGAAILTLRLAYSLFWPLQTEWQNRLVHTRDRAAALSLNAVVMDGVGIATNLAFGRMAAWHLSAAMLLGAAFCAAALALVSAAARPGPRGAEAPLNRPAAAGPADAPEASAAAEASAEPADRPERAGEGLTNTEGVI